MKLLMALLLVATIVNAVEITGVVYLDYEIYAGAKVEMKDIDHTAYIYDYSDTNGVYSIDIPFSGDWYIHCRI